MLALLARSVLVLASFWPRPAVADLGFVKLSHTSLGKRTLAGNPITARSPPRILVGRRQRQQPVSDPTSLLSIDMDLALAKQTTLPMAVMNLIKACTGAGCVCLPSIASSSGTGLGSSLVIYLIAALACAWSFSMVGVACETAEKNGALHGSEVGNFRTVWSKIVGRRSSLLIDVCQIAYASLTCACYLPMLHAFLLPALLAFGVPHAVAALPVKLGLALVLLGLTRVRYLKDLAPISALGVAGYVCTCAMVIWRSLDGSYTLLGPFGASTSAVQPPSFWALGPASFSLYLASMFAYSAHFNAPRFYGELQHRSGKRFQVLSGASFFCLAVSFMLLNVGTSATFGGAVQAPLINSYATGDPLALVCRCLYSVSMLGIYPLVFVVVWEPMERLLTTARSVAGRDLISLEGAVGLTSIAVLVGSLCITNLGSAFVKVGAALSPAFCWIFPGMLALSAGKRWGYRSRSQAVLCRAAIVWGFVQAVLGIFLSQ